jgi:hypothetical protein
MLIILFSHDFIYIIIAPVNQCDFAVLSAEVSHSPSKIVINLSDLLTECQLKFRVMKFALVS